MQGRVGTVRCRPCQSYHKMHIKKVGMCCFVFKIYTNFAFNFNKATF